jgi:hypothetical protein
MMGGIGYSYKYKENLMKVKEILFKCYGGRQKSQGKKLPQ